MRGRREVTAVRDSSLYRRHFSPSLVLPVHGLPAASPQANRTVLSAAAISKCQSNREEEPPSRQLRIHHEQVKGDVLLDVLARDLCLCPDTSSRCTAEKSQQLAARLQPSTSSPRRVFISFLCESSTLEAGQLWLGVRKSVLERYLNGAKMMQVCPRRLPDIWHAKYLD